MRVETIAENLQILVEQKQAIKQSLETKGKNPTDKIATYAGLIDELDNEEQTSYVLSNADGTQKIYAQLSSKDPVKLTATANDIRLNKSAITNTGYTDGEKDIPAYHSGYGKKIVQAGSELTITHKEYNYTHLMVTIATYDSSISESVKVTYVSIDNELYEANSTTKVSDITIDTINEKVNLGITADVKSVLRYFIMREED